MLSLYGSILYGKSYYKKGEKVKELLNDGSFTTPKSRKIPFSELKDYFANAKDLNDEFLTSFKTDSDADDVMADYDSNFDAVYGPGKSLFVYPKPDTGSMTADAYKAKYITATGGLDDFKDLTDTDVIDDLAEYFEPVDYFWINMWNGLKVNIYVYNAENAQEPGDEEGYDWEDSSDWTFPATPSTDTYTKTSLTVAEFPITSEEGVGNSDFAWVSKAEVGDFYNAPAGSFLRIILERTGDKEWPGGKVGCQNAKTGDEIATASLTVLGSGANLYFDIPVEVVKKYIDANLGGDGGSWPNFFVQVWNDLKATSIDSYTKK